MYYFYTKIIFFQENYPSKNEVRKKIMDFIHQNINVSYIAIDTEIHPE